MYYRLKSVSVATLVLSLAFPLGTLTLDSFRTSQVSAQSPKAGKAEADKLLKEGDELHNNEQYQSALKAFQEALKIYRQIKNRPGEGNALRKISNVYRELGDSKQAIACNQQALKIAQAINDTDLEAKTLINAGFVYFDLGNTQRTKEYWEKALSVARQSKNSEREANSLHLLAIFFMDGEKGIDVLEQALIAIRQAKGTPEDRLRQRRSEISILEARGGRYFVLGLSELQAKDETGIKLLDKSIQDYEEALMIAKEIGDRTTQGDILLGMSETYKIKGQYPKAIEILQQALEIFQTDKNSLSQLGETYTKLGDVYNGWGKKEQGIISYQQAFNIIQTSVNNSPLNKLQKDTKQGTLLINIGDIYFSTSKYERALESYQQALDILQSALQQSQRITSPLKNSNVMLINLGIKFIPSLLCNTYTSLGRYEEGNKFCKNSKTDSVNSSSPSSNHSASEIAKAKKDLDLRKAQESLEQARVLNNPNLEASALVEIGDAYANMEEYKLAEEYFKKAIELSKNIDNPELKPYIFGKFGLFYNKQKQYNLAINYYKQAADYAKKSGSKSIEAIIFQQIGTTSFIANNLPEATMALYKAVDVFDSMRDELSDANRISIFEKQTHAYSLLQKVLIVDNKSKEALAVSERGRARAFVNLLSLRLSKQTSSQATGKIPQILPPTIQDIQKIARQQNATIVEYSIPQPPENDDEELTWNGPKIYIWVVKPNGEIAFKQVDLKSLNTSLKDLVNKSRVSIGAGGRGINVVPTGKPVQKENLQKLHEILIEPIASLLPTNPEEKVIFIPHDSLFLVPFVALQDKDGKYFIEKHTILTAPAIQVLDLTRQQRQKVTGKDVLVMGNPIMPKVGIPPVQLDPLLGAEKEALTIANLFKIKAITGKDATKAAFKQKLSSARIIHLATHGLLDDADKSIASAIALTPTSNDDGLLTPAEIVDLKINAELVVLSACDTGRGKITGDGVVGLSRSLITAGASSVIISLWAVPDSATSELMTEFYQQWQENPDKAVALRNAMLITMKKHPQPRDWAAFTLIGES